MAELSKSWFESMRVSFVINCDDDDLTYEQGVELARQMADALLEAAESRDYAKVGS